MATEHLKLTIRNGETAEVEGRIKTLTHADKVSVSVDMTSEAGSPPKPVVELRITREGEFH